MNDLINKIAEVLEITPAEMMHRMMDMYESYEEVTPEMVKNDLLGTAYAMGCEYHSKVCQMVNEYNKAAA